MQLVWLLPVLQHMPGFGFFRGSGRYSIVTALALALLAGRGLDRLRLQLPLLAGHFMILVVCIATILDLSWVSQRITYAFMVAETPLTQVEQSPLRQYLTQLPEPARLFAPGQNLPTITGVPATPVYLGIGPSEYFDPQLTYPTNENQPADARWQTLTAEQLNWLKRAGVTHLLGFLPPDPNQQETELIWEGIDPLLNAAWGRREPLYLSNLNDTRGRASWMMFPQNRN